MSETGITYLIWSDLVGVTRTRGVPHRDLFARAVTGVGWAKATQALTPFTDIVDNPWGPTEDARMIPDLSSRFTLPGDHQHAMLDAVICDGWADLGRPWDCCVRQFCRRHLDALAAGTGLTLMASFEHEFTVTGDGAEPETPFSLTAAASRGAFLSDLDRLLTAAGLDVETVEPEFGLSQFEVSIAPRPALQAADQAVALRETVKEAARRHGLRASFSPKIAADAVGNGAHVHLSLAGPDGGNVTWDAAGPAGLSASARAAAGGILDHLAALVAVTAPSPVSYHRMTPSHWACAYRAIGVQNREAALRVIPGTAPDAEGRARGFNLEYRPVDGSAAPHLVIGALAAAMLDGVRRDAGIPEPVSVDPETLDAEARAAHGVERLPLTLGAALDALEADGTAKAWFSDRMLEVYLNLKRWEDATDRADPEASFARYARAY